MSLSEYLQQVYRLEKSCYAQQRLLAKLNDGLQQANHPKFISHKKDDEAKVRSGDIVGYIGTFFIFLLVWNIVGAVILAIFNAFESKTGILIVALTGILLPICYIVYDLNGKKKRRAALLQANQKADRFNQALQQKLSARASILSQEIKTGRETLTATQNVLQQYYGMDLIYPKYRNLPAVSMFCEYLSSGRCAQLEGPDGAYNLYEKEAQMKLIVKKLDNIIEHLELIEGTQYLLVNAVREGNQKAEEIYQSVQSTENYAAATTYFSAVAAANTTYMAWFQKNR